MTTQLDLDTLVLDKGAHDSPDEGACIMEAVALLAGEPWSDQPTCASPVVGAFLRSWNDTLDDDTRQTLKQYVPRLVGSRGTDAEEERRAWMACDWLVRTLTPTFLRVAGLGEHADRLAGLDEIDSSDDARRAREVIDAARAAAWAAARAAAKAATEAAAREAAAKAAGAAAWAAAKAARAAAWAAAKAAAEAAAEAAAREAAEAAARDAARAALAPVVAECQQSAHQLVDRMLAITEGHTP